MIRFFSLLAAIGVMAFALAEASNAATKNEIASFVAGKPVTVACDVDTNNPLGNPAVLGWTRLGANEIHLRLRLCDYLTTDPRSTVPGDLERFTLGLMVLVHEAFHARGVFSEACANTYAQLISFDVLRRYWNVPFFTGLSWTVGGIMNQLMRKQPAAYWPSCPS